jgi:hypothetical protein
MPVPALVATPGAADANAYCTVAEADAYHDAKVHRDDWAATGTESDAKTVAIIEATRLIDSMFVWEGCATDTDQALDWPRHAMTGANGRGYIASDEIPVQLKNATAEFARQLIAADRTADSDVQTQGITRVKAGSVDISFDAARVQTKVVPDAVVNLLPAWWFESVAGRQAAYRRLVRA